MRSVRTAIFCSIVAGWQLLGCAASPVGLVPGSREEQPDELPGDDLDDDEVDGMEDAVSVDDDDADDDDDRDDPPQPSRDAGVDARTGDGAVADAAADAGIGARFPDAALAQDASAPGSKVDAAAVDAARLTPVDAAASVRDAASNSGNDASTSAVCAPGTYRGTFTGEITSALSRARITATITFTLAASGSTLRIQSGSMDGRDADGNAITAQVGGALNCATRRLENAVLRDGVYSIREGLLDSIRFDGTLAGTLSANAPGTVAGTWTLRSALGTRDGSGSFTATAQ